MPIRRWISRFDVALTALQNLARNPPTPYRDTKIVSRRPSAITHLRATVMLQQAHGLQIPKYGHRTEHERDYRRDDSHPQQSPIDCVRHSWQAPAARAALAEAAA